MLCEEKARERKPIKCNCLLLFLFFLFLWRFQISTQRYFNILLTSITFKKRRIDVQITSCVNRVISSENWVEIIFFWKSKWNILDVFSTFYQNFVRCVISTCLKYCCIPWQILIRKGRKFLVFYFRIRFLFIKYMTFIHPTIRFGKHFTIVDLPYIFIHTWYAVYVFQIKIKG